MSTHTPGPWTISGAATETRPSNQWLHGATGERIGTCDRREDAQLIAAAPELYAFAKAALLFHGGGEWDQGLVEEWTALTGAQEATTRVLCNTARTAIAKAEGRS